MKHEEIVRSTIKVLCDALGAEWDVEYLVPSVLAAVKTSSDNLRRRTVEHITAQIRREVCRDK
jgi:hypothetical protein